MQGRTEPRPKPELLVPEKASRVDLCHDPGKQGLFEELLYSVQLTYGSIKRWKRRLFTWFNEGNPAGVFTHYWIVFPHKDCIEHFLEKGYSFSRKIFQGHIGTTLGPNFA